MASLAIAPKFSVAACTDGAAEVQVPTALVDHIAPPGALDTTLAELKAALPMSAGFDIKVASSPGLVG